MLFPCTLGDLGRDSRDGLLGSVGERDQITAADDPNAPPCARQIGISVRAGRLLTVESILQTTSPRRQPSVSWNSKIRPLGSHKWTFGCIFSASERAAPHHICHRGQGSRAVPAVFIGPGPRAYAGAIARSPARNGTARLADHLRADWDRCPVRRRHGDDRAGQRRGTRVLRTGSCGSDADDSRRAGSGHGHLRARRAGRWRRRITRLRTCLTRRSVSRLGDWSTAAACLSWWRSTASWVGSECRQRGRRRTGVNRPGLGIACGAGLFYLHLLSRGHRTAQARHDCHGACQRRQRGAQLGPDSRTCGVHSDGRGRCRARYQHCSMVHRAVRVGLRRLAGR